MSNISVVEAINYCLRPLVQVCLRFDIDHRALSEMLKAMFVSVAAKEMAARGDAATDSRIASMTGVPDEEVRQLREYGSLNKPARGNSPLAARLIAHWVGKPALLDEWGHPRPLPFQSIGDGVSFEELAREVAADIEARELLEEFKLQGVVMAARDDVVHLKVDVMIPDGDVGQKAAFFAKGLHDHIAAAGHNLMGGTPAFLDRHVWHSDMTEVAAAHLAVMAEMAAMQALKSVNQQALEYDASAEVAGDHEPRNVRINFGTYFYSTVQEAEDPLPPSA